VGNAWEWSLPQTFGYVNTTPDYVPDEFREAYVHRLLERSVQPAGRLLIAQYLGRTTGMPEIRIDEELRILGCSIEMVKSSYLEQDPLRQTRVAVIRNTTD
jgi:hypothetical protein